MKEKLREYESEAIQLLRSSKEAVLSTVSEKFKGYPFGSFVTFISGQDRSIIIYASDIAQHTINLKKNSKSCLTVFKLEEENDKQDSARLTLLGDLVKLPDDEVKSNQERFVKFLPESKKYSSMHDFNFYRLEISQARWIGGFGKIAWLKNNNWRPIGTKWSNNEESIIDHMNNDHSKNISASLNAQHGIKDKNAKMFALTIDGYYLRSEDKIYFIAFDEICINAKEYKDTLVNQAKEYRSFEI